MGKGCCREACSQPAPWGCRLLQNLLGGEQGALPGWWASNLPPANKSVVPTQAATVSVHVLRGTEGEERKPAPQPSYGEVYSLSQACALQACCRAAERFRGCPPMDRAQGRPGLASPRAEFPAAALKPLQPAVIPGPFRGAQAPRSGSASRAPPALTNELIAELGSSKVCLYQCLMRKCAAEIAACH